jgi:hypothetical protein
VEGGFEVERAGGVQRSGVRRWRSGFPESAGALEGGAGLPEAVRHAQGVAHEGPGLGLEEEAPRLAPLGGGLGHAQGEPRQVEGAARVVRRGAHALLAQALAHGPAPVALGALQE